MSFLTCLDFSCVYCFFLKRWNYIKILLCMNKSYFVSSKFFLTDWRHKRLKNTIDLLLFHGEHFYEFSESENEKNNSISHNLDNWFIIVRKIKILLRVFKTGKVYILHVRHTFPFVVHTFPFVVFDRKIFQLFIL